MNPKTHITTTYHDKHKIMKTFRNYKPHTPKQDQKLKSQINAKHKSASKPHNNNAKCTV